VSELRIIAQHAGTVLVGQLAVMAFGVTDTIVAGRYSEQALAALSVGSAVYATVFVALNGTMQALLPTWARLHGAQRNEDVGRSVRQALYLAACALAIGAWALTFPEAILRWTQVPPGLQRSVGGYLGVLTLALPPALLFRMFSTLNQALGRPVLVTWLQAISLAVKVPLTIWFVFGGLGVPAQGAVGCAWATVVVNWLLLASAVWLLRTQALYRPYALWRRIERPDWPAIAHFARLGIPGGLAVLVEVTSFTLMALFIARQGVLASAAHQVAANMAAVLYMTPLSIAIATSSRVSYWLGGGDNARARSAIGTGFRLGLALAVSLSAVVALGRWQIAAIYSGNAQVVALAASLLGWVALYHLGDSTQAMCVFVLRCYHVAIAPMVAYTVLLWGVGLTGGYLLAYHPAAPALGRDSPAAFWAASTIALALLAVVLPLILRHAVRTHDQG
jgi:multidrug resistance protein, MATE family